MSNQSITTDAQLSSFVRAEMRANKITIREFAKFSGMSQDRVREVRNTGRAKWHQEWVLTLRDCIRAKAA